MAISNFAALTVTINGGLSLSVGQSAHASFDQFIAFGDSSIDSGYFLTHTISNNASQEALYQQAAAAGGGKPTDPNQPMNSELLAQSYGLTAIPVGMSGGTNYAASGATQTGSLPNSLAPSVTSQISTYLGSTGGVADPNALYYFAGGGNDIKVAQGMSTTAAAKNYMLSEADSIAASIVQLRNAGAQNFVLDDMNGGNTSSLAVIYNDRLWSDLASAGVQFIVADDNLLLRRMTNSPQNFGITNTTKPPAGPFTGGNPYSASNGGAVVNPHPSTIPDSWALYGTQDVSANAANTYLWADDEHLAEVGQSAVANYTHNAIEHAAPVISETLQATLANPFAAQNGIANTTYQWQHLQNGQTAWTDIAGATSSSYTVASTDAGSELRVEAFFSDTNGNTAAGASPASYTVAATNAANNFSGNGHSGILWQNADGTPAIWTMDGTNLTQGQNIAANPGPDWHVVGSGDFNGDGKSDILWQNKDGTIAEWFLNGTNLTSGGSVAFNPGPSWHAMGSGDFNGDGKSDILFQNTDGTPAVWLMNGLNILSGTNVGFNPGPDWHVIGAADFNGDGMADILWQNKDGTPAVWLMNGTNLISGANAGFNPGADWHVVGTGDFDGDGKADILWQNKDGTPAVWLMNGTNLISGANVGFNPGPSWHAVGTGDFNGDGKSDILWQNDDGTSAVWLMNGTSVISGANVGSDPGSSWHVVPQHHDVLV
jgi:phospholipase/lecithinase/hemolysin